MKQGVRHYGVVKNGRTLFHNQQLYFQNLVALEGKEFELVIKQRHRAPSRSQINYYFGGICGSCFESEHFATFNKADDVHYLYFAPLFLSYTVEVEVKGTKRMIRKERSLSELSMEEISAFIEKTKLHAEVELGVIILGPEDYYNKYYNK